MDVEELSTEILCCDETQLQNADLPQLRSWCRSDLRIEKVLVYYGLELQNNNMSFSGFEQAWVGMLEDLIRANKGKKGLDEMTELGVLYTQFREKIDACASKGATTSSPVNYLNTPGNPATIGGGAPGSSNSVDLLSLFDSPTPPVSSAGNSTAGAAGAVVSNEPTNAQNQSFSSAGTSTTSTEENRRASIDLLNLLAAGAGADEGAATSSTTTTGGTSTSPPPHQATSTTTPAAGSRNKDLLEAESPTALLLDSLLDQTSVTSGFAAVVGAAVPVPSTAQRQTEPLTSTAAPPAVATGGAVGLQADLFSAATGGTASEMKEQAGDTTSSTADTNVNVPQSYAEWRARSEMIIEEKKLKEQEEEQQKTIKNKMLKQFETMNTNVSFVGNFLKQTGTNVITTVSTTVAARSGGGNDDVIVGSTTAIATTTGTTSTGGVGVAAATSGVATTVLDFVNGEKTTGSTTVPAPAPPPPSMQNIGRIQLLPIDVNVPINERLPSIAPALKKCREEQQVVRFGHRFISTTLFPTGERSIAEDEATQENNVIEYVCVNMESSGGTSTSTQQQNSSDKAHQFSTKSVMRERLDQGYLTSETEFFIAGDPLPAEIFDPLTGELTRIALRKHQQKVLSESLLTSSPGLTGPGGSGGSGSTSTSSPKSGSTGSSGGLFSQMLSPHKPPPPAAASSTTASSEGEEKMAGAAKLKVTDVYESVGGFLAGVANTIATTTAGAGTASGVQNNLVPGGIGPGPGSKTTSKEAAGVAPGSSGGAPVVDAAVSAEQKSGSAGNIVEALLNGNATTTTSPKSTDAAVIPSKGSTPPPPPPAAPALNVSDLKFEPASRIVNVSLDSLLEDSTGAQGSKTAATGGATAAAQGDNANAEISTAASATAAAVSSAKISSFYERIFKKTNGNKSPTGAGGAGGTDGGSKDQTDGTVSDEQQKKQQYETSYNSTPTSANATANAGTSNRIFDLVSSTISSSTAGNKPKGKMLQRKAYSPPTEEEDRKMLLRLISF
ncbi:unnamed protein product [Amoebophrya sp. A120]|nr:unnamed protein product [Amoebophrya sp. A120]|eukprot:GSA120T00014577001.1